MIRTAVSRSGMAPERERREMLERIKSSLQAKIIIAVVAVLAATLGASYFMEVRENEKVFVEKLHVEIKNISAVVTSAIHNVMLRDDKTTLDLMIGQVGKVGVVKRLYIIEPGGEVYATSDKAVAGRLEGDIFNEARQSGEAAFELREAVDGEPFVMAVVPIMAKPACLECHSSVGVNEPVGFLGLERWAGEDVRRLHAEKRKHALMSLLTIAVSCLALAWSLRRLVTGPIRVLRQSSEKIGDGRLDHRIELSTHDEIERLAEGFNRMAAKLGDSHARLEQKVVERTETLAEEILVRERAEKALLESEQKFRSLVDSTSEWVWELDRAGAYVFTSGKVKDLLGYEPEEIIGRTPFEFMPPVEAKRVGAEVSEIVSRRESLLSAAGGGLPQDGPEPRTSKRIRTSAGRGESLVEDATRRGFVKDYEVTLKTKDGKELIVLATVSEVRGAENELTGYRGIIRDVTEQKMLERQFIQAQKMESIGTLASGIAHDFDNILATIMSYASLIKTGILEDSEIFGQADAIERSVDRAARLTKQLLGFAREGEHEAEPVNLNAIADETLKIVGSTFEKSIEIETRYHKLLPTVEGDAGQLEQVLMNLCVNARDAMDGRGKLIVETGVEAPAEGFIRRHLEARPGLYATLSVSDTGVGIDRENLQKIFEPFFTTKGEGTGLGLSMVYGIVKSHGGFVSVYSEPCVRTTLKVYLPASGKPEVEETAGAETPFGDNELILVVDDEEHQRSLAGEMLETFGYRVLTAEDGSKAVEIYGKHKDEIDLAILDMVMPKMGGRETFLKLKEMDPHVKALLSSGYSPDAKVQMILDAGVIGFVRKPFHLNELLSEVRSALNAGEPA